MVKLSPQILGCASRKVSHINHTEEQAGATTCSPKQTTAGDTYILFSSWSDRQRDTDRHRDKDILAKEQRVTQWDRNTYRNREEERQRRRRMIWWHTECHIAWLRACSREQSYFRGSGEGRRRGKSNALRAPEACDLALGCSSRISLRTSTMKSRRMNRTAWPALPAEERDESKNTVVFATEWTLWFGAEVSQTEFFQTDLCCLGNGLAPRSQRIEQRSLIKVGDKGKHPC